MTDCYYRLRENGQQTLFCRERQNCYCRMARHQYRTGAVRHRLLYLKPIFYLRAYILYTI